MHGGITNHTESVACRICGGETVAVATIRGKFKVVDFDLRRCISCAYAFIANPWTEYGRIYDNAYYNGQGADPLVDYIYEFDHPETTIRHYEWRGILSAVKSLTEVRDTTKWLDFGCGTGALGRYVRERTGCAVVGYEDGNVPRRAPGLISSGRDLDAMSEAFDVITAIEVLEHLVNPLEVLIRLRRLLKPGGLLFALTANARPFRNRLATWRYVGPEVHVGFFEPETLENALRLAGFRPEFRCWTGLSDVIRFKVLKNVQQRNRSVLEQVLPWPILSRLVNSRYHVDAHPVGWAR